jgi:hypothetical protein
MYYCLYAVLGAAIMAFVLRLAHVLKRQRQIRCHHCGSLFGVKKRYQMIPLKDNWHELYVFAVCSCGEVRFIRSENKCYTSGQLARRHKKWPEQFAVDQLLFKRSGLITEHLSSFGMRLAQLRETHRNSRLQQLSSPK